MRRWLVGHRGNSAHEPENTHAGFASAVAAGAHAIETDLRLSRDGHVVLYHDDVLERLTAHSGSVETLTVAELTHLSVRHPNGREDHIPTLTDTLRKFEDRAWFYLELKSDGQGRANPHNAALLDATLAAVEPTTSHVLASFDADLVRGAIEAQRAAALIVDRWEALAVLTEREIKALRAISLRHDLIDARAAKQILEWDIALWAWTIDEREEATRVLDLGCEAICTNNVTEFGHWWKQDA